MLMGRAKIGMAMTIAHFVAVKILYVAAISVFVTPMFSTIWIAAAKSIVAVEMIIDMSPEVVWTVVPRSGANEDPVHKPLRSIVSVGCAVIGRVIEIAVRTDGRRADLHSNLGAYSWGGNRETERGYSK